MANQDWLFTQWTKLFGEAISSMAGQAVNVNAISTPSTAEPLIWWSQKLSLGPQELIWVGAPEQCWKAIGRIALVGAGIDDPSDEDIDGTFRELVQQALSSLAQAIGQQLKREVTCSDGKLGPDTPTASSLSMAVECNGETIFPYQIGFDATLLEALEVKVNAAAAGAESQVTRIVSEQQTETRNSIELLLDVELPVGVSFGKAILPLRDVIKLTTGSIVELNRSVTEPVEVIVNNCVIAKGEVVVVDGNYGVRINHIVSRQERLRSIH